MNLELLKKLYIVNITWLALKQLTNGIFKTSTYLSENEVAFASGV